MFPQSDGDGLGPRTLGAWIPLYRAYSFKNKKLAGDNWPGDASERVIDARFVESEATKAKTGL